MEEVMATFNGYRALVTAMREMLQQHRDVYNTFADVLIQHAKDKQDLELLRLVQTSLYETREMHERYVHKINQIVAELPS